MKTFKKNYIGKGTQHATMDIVRVTLNVSELQKYLYRYEGENYITFDLAKMLQPTKFGRTHTAYVVSMEETPDNTNESKSGNRKLKLNKAEA